MIGSGDRVADADARIETGERILEHHLDALAHLANPLRSSARISASIKSISPPLGSTSRRIERPVVDLPQPDSPTSAKRLARDERKRNTLHRVNVTLQLCQTGRREGGSG